MKNYQAYLYAEDKSIVFVELFDDEWANFDKGFALEETLLCIAEWRQQSKVEV